MITQPLRCHQVYVAKNLTESLYYKLEVWSIKEVGT